MDFLYVFDYSNDKLHIIEWTDEMHHESEKYDDFEMYLTTLQTKYGFDLEYSAYCCNPMKFEIVNHTNCKKPFDYA